VIAIPWSPQTFRRKREVIQPSSDSANGARPMRAEARAKLLSTVAKGLRWLDGIIAGSVFGIEAIAAREGVSERSARMGLSLAFLAPDIVQAAIDGTLARGPAVSRLTDIPALIRSAAGAWHRAKSLSAWPAYRFFGNISTGSQR
jgi:site-specific DNA recombinase